MSKIKYNESGEVVSVNGLTTGHQLGTPMQDAIGTVTENSAHGTELDIVTRCGNTIDDNQPKANHGSFNDWIVCYDPKAQKNTTLDYFMDMKISFPDATSAPDSACYWCESLLAVDLPKATYIGVEAFAECYNLSTVILRTTKQVCEIESGAFAFTLILGEADLPLGEGFIYVPASMFEAYCAKYKVFAAAFRKIEDYPEICGTN